MKATIYWCSKVFVILGIAHQIQVINAAELPFNDGINESHIAVLDASNFYQAINSTQYALVQFYAPWCRYCKEFRPAFAEASLLLREWKTPVLVAKIDGDSHKELAIKFQISTTPTTLLFENGEVQAEFSNEDPTAAGILSWVEKFINGSSVELASMEQFSELEQDLQAAAVVAYFKNNSVALAESTTAFYWTSNAAVARELEINVHGDFDMAILRLYPGHPPAVALFSSQNSSGIDQHESGDLVERLETFFAAQKLPDYINYEEAREDSGRLLLSVPIPYHMYVVGPGSKLNDAATVAALRGAAAQLRGEIGLLISDIADKDETGINTVADLFHIDQNNAEIFAGVVGVANNKRYACNLHPGAELTSTALVDCGRAVLKGHATRLYSSQPVPKNPKDGNVTVVVGATVDAIAKDPKKDVLLEVYAPWCTACQAFAKTYNKLAAAMASNVPSVVIGKIDGTRNEHADLDIEEFPTLLFYPAEDGAKPVKLEVADLKELVAAIQAKAKVPFEIPNLDVFENVDFDREFDEEDDEYLDSDEIENATAAAVPAAAGLENVQAPSAAAMKAALHEEL